MLFFIFWPLPEKIARLSEKKYFARLSGAAAPPRPPSSYAYARNMTSIDKSRRTSSRSSSLYVTERMLRQLKASSAPVDTECRSTCTVITDGGRRTFAGVVGRFPVMT